VTPSELREDLDIHKTRMNVLSCGEESLTIYSAVLIQCQRVTDGRTDRRTDVQPISITCFSIADARNVKIFTARRLIKELPTKKMKNTNIGRLSAKVAKNRFDRTHCDDSLKMCCLYAVLDLPGSVETKLGCNGKFY